MLICFRALLTFFTLFAVGVGFVAPSYAAEIDKVKVRVTDIEAQLNKLNESAQSLESRLQNLENISKAQPVFLSQIQELRGQIATLRGDVEVLQHQIEQADRRRQDFYTDLDGRLRKLESGQSPGGGVGSPSGSTTSPAISSKTTTDAESYEEALNFFKAENYARAAAAFDQIAARSPNSDLLPNVYYWGGYSQLKLTKPAEALQKFSTVITRWPTHAKVPDALLGKYNAQKALGDVRGAQVTLRQLLQNYPTSAAAGIAQQKNTSP